MVTDVQLANDAKRLAEVAQELLELAARLQMRFPSSRTLASTVDRFLAAALNEAA